MQGIQYSFLMSTTQRIALFPGSFDPITIAHVDIINRALLLFDKLVVGIGSNSNKESLLSIDKRLEIVKAVFSKHPKIEIESYEGLTTNFCAKKQIKYLVRGIRSVSDFEYERPIAQINQVLKPNIETIFILSRAENTAISSSIVRELLRYESDVAALVPKEALPFFTVK